MKQVTPLQQTVTTSRSKSRVVPLEQAVSGNPPSRVMPSKKTAIATTLSALGKNKIGKKTGTQVVPAKNKSLNKTLSDIEITDHGAAVTLQSWWRMHSAHHTYREHLRLVHKVMFAVAFAIRLFVVSYLIGIMSIVAISISDRDFEDNNPANAYNLEQIVQAELLKANSWGYLNIAACGCVLI